ncbi:MAG: hypothetical protein JWP45_3599 [Mucilaginibacter sp.]|nr:hypothetical protein [Mucilaginibacter sp.]
MLTHNLIAMASETTVHAHNSQHFENLQLSSKEFYTLLKAMIESYQYPEVSCTPITLKESGIFSSKREYLRISKQRYHYYVCASPFGKSFFISWWLQEDANTAANVTRKLGWLGRAVATRIESKTYYELDTELMFTSSITSIIKMAVEKVKADKGYRKDIEIVTA